MPRLGSSRRVNPGARNIPYTIRGGEMPGEPGPEDWQPALAPAQADRHQAWKACAAQSSSVKQGQPMSSARCNPIKSNQPAQHGDYFKTNGGFKPSENGFGKLRVKPETSMLQPVL